MNSHKAVLIDTRLDDIKEIDLDIDSDKNEIFNILGGPATFIGQWPETDVVIMKCRESVMRLYKNENTLGSPFHTEDVLGKILLVRMDENAEHKDFTLSEFQESTLFHRGQLPRNA